MWYRKFELNKALIHYNLVSAYIGFPGGSMVKNLPANEEMHETLVRSLDREDPLQEGNPLQDSCLKNLMDRETWWPIVHGVAKSRTRLSN